MRPAYLPLFALLVGRTRNTRLVTEAVEAFSGMVREFRLLDFCDAPVRELMRDVKAVDWLPLGDAIKRLSRGYERAFLENVGPIALAAATNAAGAAEPNRAAEPVRDIQRAPRSLLQKIRDWLGAA